LFCGLKTIKSTAPKIEASSEADKIPILARSEINGSAIASPVTNNDIVKPIPPKKPSPKTCFQLTPVGKDAIPITVDSQENKTMPIGLPTTRPSTTPIETGDVKKLESASVEISTPALKNAKTGMIKKLTQG